MRWMQALIVMVGLIVKTGCALKEAPLVAQEANLSIAERWTAPADADSGLVDTDWLASFENRPLERLVAEALQIHLVLCGALGQTCWLPFTRGGRLQAEVEIRTAQQKQALAAYASAGLRAFQEVETALANEEVLRQREEQLLAVVRIAVGLGVLGGCGRANEYVEPPPPEVTVSQPLQRDVIDYLEYTGTTEAVKTVDVRARVTGFLESVHFEAGARLPVGICSL